MNIPLLFDETATISGVWTDEGATGIRVGMDGVTRIEVYREHGNSGNIPWFAAYAGDKLVARFNGTQMTEVNYV